MQTKKRFKSSQFDELYYSDALETYIAFRFREIAYFYKPSKNTYLLNKKTGKFKKWSRTSQFDELI